MMNMPDVTKRKVSLQLPIATIMRIDKMAQTICVSRNEIATVMLDKATAGVVLTDGDLKKINAEIRRNREKRIR
ncbi:MAG: hypothetical protein FWH21_00860 [Kiritimatiellaeota bacterium]|nr:hypothetical protein [Kiritimatiellota bacterium]